MAKKEAKARKKKPTKKKSAKQAVTITVRKHILGKAPEEHQFILKDGRKLRTIYELVDELETMGEEAFKEHVNEYKNDFANWIENVFSGKTLAEELRRIQNRMDTQRAILKELVRELTKLSKKHERR